MGDYFNGIIDKVCESFHNTDDLKVRRFVLDGSNAALFFLDGLNDNAMQRELMRILMGIEGGDAAMSITYEKEKRDNALKDGQPEKGGFFEGAARLYRSVKEGLTRPKIGGGESVTALPTGVVAGKTGDEALAFILARLAAVTEADYPTDFEDLLKSVSMGDTIIVTEGCTRALRVSTKMWEKRPIAEPPTGTILQGPREGFTEDLKTNMSLLRKRLHTPDLIIEKSVVGRYSGTQYALCYISGIASGDVIQKIKERLSVINIDGITDIHQLEEFLDERPNSIFKQAGHTEKSDVAVAKMLEGRVAIMLDGSPVCLTLPFMFFEDMQSAQDYYDRPSFSTFMRVLRLVCIVIALFLPGIYIAVQVFHYEIISLKLLITLAGAMHEMPLKPFLETVAVILLFETIHEASIRMPRYSGMALSIVGALVLGDTAVKAGVITSPTVMVVALSSVSLYMVPEQVGSLSILRLILTVVAGLGGILGLVLGFIFLAVYLASINSYGTPYLAPFAPNIKSDLKDSIVLRNMRSRTQRPYSIPTVNRTRQRERRQK